MRLTDAQLEAIDNVRAHARSRKAEARAMLAHIFRMIDAGASDLDHLLDSIRAHARVAVHFHPDRPCAAGHPVAQGLLDDGRYRNQYETRISNGGLTAHPGGRRDACEQRLFGGAYHGADVSAAERPKYGALELLRHAEGPSPRFGSCYLVLHPRVLPRCTFTFLDSHEDPTSRGTADELDDVVAALLREAFLCEQALGERELPAPALLRRLREDLVAERAVRADDVPPRNLNQYVEAQVHGDIDLGTDVESIVADPSFRNTDVGRLLASLCARHGLLLAWHHGYRLKPADVPRDFRGPSMPSLAARVAGSGDVHAAAIGAAVVDLCRRPEAWRDRGSFDDVLQELKLLWHVLVRYGEPCGAPYGPGATKPSP